MNKICNNSTILIYYFYKNWTLFLKRIYWNLQTLAAYWCIYVHLNIIKTTLLIST